MPPLPPHLVMVEHVLGDVVEAEREIRHVRNILNMEN